MARRLSLVVPVLALLLAGCQLGSTSGVRPPSTLPADVVPATVLGHQVVAEHALDARFSPKGRNSLISGGRLYTIRTGATVEGSLQVTVFRPDVNGQDPGVQKGIESSLGSGGRGFQTLHFGLVRLLALSLGQEQLYLWFPPEHNVMELFVLRSGFADRGAFVRAVVAHQLGLVVPLPSSGGTS